LSKKVIWPDILVGGDADTWYPELWKWICANLNVRSVLDVGCGEGHSTKFFKELGCEVLGVDGSAQAKRDSVIPEFHMIHDFTAGPFIPPRTYDCVWSCEFVEHVEEEHTGNFLKTFSCSGKYIIMTHATPGWGGYHHVNCRPGEYWIRKMHKIGFRICRNLTMQAREKAGHGYFQRTGLVFVKSPYIKLLPAGAYLYLSSLGSRVMNFYKRHGLLKTILKIAGKGQKILPLFLKDALQVRRMLKLTAKRPLILIIQTTNVCNARCVFCCYGKMKIEPQVLSLELFEKVIREYSEMGGGAVSLTPVPGDVLLDPHLLRRYEIMGKYKNIDQISFTTNGIAFEKYSDEELKYILRSSFMVQISIGGLDREGYKSLYQVDQFENVLKAVTRLLEMKKAMKDDVHIHLAFRTGNPRFEEEHREQLDAYRRQGCLVSHLSSYGSFGGIVKSDEVKNVQIIDGSRLVKRDTCVFPILMPTVLANGMITNCGCVDVSGDYLGIGDARKDSLGECWRSQKRQTVLDSFPQGKLTEICRQCSLYRPSAHLASPVYNNIRSYQNLPLEFYMLYGG
jgi:hypothetical protein